MGKESKRKQILINKRFQYKMIIKFVLLNLFILIIFNVACYIFMSSEIESNLKSAHVTYKNVREMLLPIIILLSLINFLVSSIIITVFVLLSSFRIAGPMYRFNEACKELSKRNLNTITSLREDDQLVECSISLTGAIRNINDDICMTKNKIHQLRNLMHEKSSDEVIIEKIDELDTMLGKYTCVVE